LFKDFLYEGKIEISKIKDDNMVFVPGGCSVIGNDDPNFDDEFPLVDILLSPFYIDKYEVSNEEYKECVINGGCDEPEGNSGRLWSSAFKKYPVVNVTWNMADKYCRWKGKCLPTEAQWIKAAGGAKGKKYPWGDELVFEGESVCDYANIFSCSSDIEEITDNISGKSMVGCFNMAGNVMEWVGDWYDPYYYAYLSSILNKVDPSGPLFNTGEKVIKGGSFKNSLEDVRIGRRYHKPPDFYAEDTGFRCVSYVNPVLSSEGKILCPYDFNQPQ